MRERLTLGAIASLMLVLHASADPLTDALRAGAGSDHPFIVERVELPALQDDAAPLPVTLRLRRFRVVHPDAEFVAIGQDGRTRPIPFDHESLRFVRGTVEGFPGSHAVFVVRPTSITGAVSLGPGRTGYVLNDGDEAMTAPSRRGRLRSAPTQVSLEYPDVPTCATLVSSSAPATGRGPGRVTRAIHQVRLAIETDRELRELFNSNDETLIYLVTMHALVADMLLRDADVTFSITFARIWERDDPFVTSDPMTDLFDAWSNGEMRDVPRDIVHHVSGRRDLPASGRASGIGTISACTGIAWSGYMQGIAEPGPSVLARDVLLSAHEIGHLLGGRHTHSMGIDNCPTNGPAQRGTIMSYCGLTFTGESGALDPRYHRLVSDEIRTAVEAGCLGTDCDLNGVPDSVDIVLGRLVDSDGNGVADRCEDCDSDGVPDIDTIQSDPTLDLNDNGILDVCEPDCDNDGVPDAITFANDLNGNNIPDECEPDLNENGVSDLVEINSQMTLDRNRNTVLDAYEDCDGDLIPDLDALGGAGAIWIADASAGHLTRCLALVGVPERLSAGVVLDDPRDVIVTPDGLVLVTDGTDSVIEFDADGTYRRHLIGPDDPSIADPRSMLALEDGSLAIVSAGRNAVARVDIRLGTPLPDLIAPSADGPIGPDGLVIDEQGRVFVTSSDQRLLRYDAPDATPTVLVGAGAAGSAQLVDPRGLLLLPNGALLVASYGSDRLLEFEPDTGIFRGRFDAVGTLQIDGPHRLRLSRTGTLLVSRTNADNAETGLAALLRQPRILELDASTGRLIRSFVQGRDSGIQNPTGFAILPNEGRDCNGNLIPDGCETRSGASLDQNLNDVPDECERAACLVDLNADGFIGIEDLLLYLDVWIVESPDAEVTGDVTVTILDLLRYLQAWLTGSPLGLCD